MNAASTRENTTGWLGYMCARWDIFCAVRLFCGPAATYKYIVMGLFQARKFGVLPPRLVVCCELANRAWTVKSFLILVSKE